EVAVDAFLDGRLRFDRIHAVNMETLEAVLPSKPGALADLMAIDATAREAANTAVLRYAR
ncbi:MAG: 1-deoxy-D-xylulose-5-phosphate reductoisomerase, partial [Gammaproteobacteria bacterium]|nr:1-deoxy-D-xylulose-5-phosphate reductoisomerase [Gammaproteobacteria bacterium]